MGGLPPVQSKITQNVKGGLSSSSLWITLAQYLNESVEVYSPFSAMQTIRTRGRVEHDFIYKNNSQRI